MKKIFTNLSLLVTRRLLLTAVLPFLCLVAMMAQPNNMSINQDISAAQSNTSMTLKGGVYQARFLEVTAKAAGVGLWQFNSDSYSNVWGATTPSTLSGFNTIIPPSGSTASANWVVGGYNQNGKLAATLAGSYYTYNITKGSSYSSQNMAILQTTYSPNALAVTHTAGTTTVTLAAVLAAGEYLYVRSSTDNFNTSSISQVAMSGTSGTFGLLNGTCSYYFYSSNQSITTIASSVATYGQGAHDLLMLNVANNAGSNYAASAVSLPVQVTSTTGTASLFYATLSNALNGINFGVHSGVVTVSVLGNTTESAAAILNASTVSTGSVASSYTSLSVKPSGGAARTITGSISTALVDLLGADNVTIDGLNTGGNTLTISNTSTTATATIRLYSDATGNTVQNCTILGGALNSSGGTVFIGAAGATGGAASTGNDNNLITLNNIGPVNATTTTAYNGIYAASGGTSFNDAVTISNNNIYDYYGGTTPSGVLISAGNSNWTISGNSIYQTIARAGVTGALVYGINCGATNNAVAMIISGNYIGGSGVLATGTLTINGTAATTRFVLARFTSRDRFRSGQF